ncbi:UDP-N-acetylglucosamine 2-epimerase (non-hydrolyzing) [Altererythrobacter soli]|uniref:UDP-N-acetylglucosamine 2-epimerase (Non-hydrolyzing) n=1 Tax=Croceibacterium soli TaxID=1739690 RepID=A0A6I4URA9_9SPHN|nr:UDP-N-acetylglucosamine 2-epimerase (non-hydrolyzing) [Croceibacterium soli]MXP40274.1 UDP-N-acetylglucosamine 2-epimerase (non-hydrolyzing) [Croceibacterium soli]
MTRILTVVGARPQFIKAAVVSHQIAKNPGVSECLVHTGQHHDANMSDVFFEDLAIPPPAHHLGIAGLSHGAMTGRMLEGLEGIIKAEAPDWVLVYGDTNSTVAGALASAKLGVPVAHIEAGLRSFNRMMPEEINRVLTDHCSDLLFTPTDEGTANLLREGLPPERIVQAGDVMFDAALHFGKLAAERNLSAAARGLCSGDYVLATVHRQENTDDIRALKKILEGLSEVAMQLPVILPLHPRTRARISAEGLEPLTTKLTVLDPLGYLEMIALESGAAVIATDSGGVQKEAFFQRVPCVTLRTETEWTELVVAGWNRLAPMDTSEQIAATILNARGTRGADVAPYGDGASARKIIARLIDQ